MTLDEEIMTIPPAEQVKVFTEIIAEPSDVLEVRGIHEATGSIRQAWSYASKLPDMLPKLQRWNADGFNIHPSANPRRDFGLAGDVNVPLSRCLFADFDPANGFKDIPDFLNLIDAKGLPEPSAVVSSGHGAWAFWRLAEAVTDMGAWRVLQRRLSTVLETDASAKNPERMTRLPGFWNLKPPRAYAWLYQVDTELAYPLDRLTAVLPVLPTAPTSTPTPRPTAAPDALARARAWLAKVPVPAKGARNTTMFNIAGHLYAFGLGEGDVAVLMTGFNALLNPPLDPRELKALVASAGKSGTPREPKPSRPLPQRRTSWRSPFYVEAAT